MSKMPKLPEGTSQEVSEDTLDVPEQEAPFVPSPLRKKLIEVKALQKGFIHNHRRSPGDKFTIASMEDLGDWMECTDPMLAKQHKAMIAQRKADQKAELKASGGK